MGSRFLFVLSIFLSLSACEKPSIYSETYAVTYTVNAYGNQTPEFHIQYRDVNGLSVSEGNFTNHSWNSPNIKGFEKGAYVEMKIKSFTSQNSYTLRVYANGNLLFEEILVNPASELTLSGYLPQY